MDFVHGRFKYVLNAVGNAGADRHGWKVRMTGGKGMPKPTKEQALNSLLHSFYKLGCWAGDELPRRQLMDVFPWKAAYFLPTYFDAERAGWLEEFERHAGFIVRLTPAGAEKVAELFGHPRKAAVDHPDEWVPPHLDRRPA